MEENKPKREARHGRKPNQKLKPYLVMQYLLKETDENHLRTADEIVAYLQECGIYAERRSIYRDIEEINKAALMLEEGGTIDEAAQMLEEDGGEDLKMISYDKKNKGFYALRRQYDSNDIRLLAECIYAARFIAEGQAKRLVDVVCEWVSDYQAEKIRHGVFLTDRTKTANKSVLYSIATINEAMSRKVDGQPHKPEKISFKYLKYEIGDIHHQVERRKGQRYVVSPFQLLINDGNYYLLGFDDKSKKMRTYRVDRMRDVRAAEEPREGEEIFRDIDLKTYTQRVFSMYGGTQRRVTMRFISPLLDAAVDRFGTKEAQYVKTDEKHFEVTAAVEVSDPFFGWLLGFGRRVKLVGPEDVVDEFRAYMDKIREMY